MSTQVRITNTYSDRTNSTIETVPTPDLIATRGLNNWWQDAIFPLTGDGHGTSQYAIYEAEIIDSDWSRLIGLRYEWDG